MTKNIKLANESNKKFTMDAVPKPTLKDWVAGAGALTLGAAIFAVGAFYTFIDVNLTGGLLSLGIMGYAAHTIVDSVKQLNNMIERSKNAEHKSKRKADPEPAFA